MNEIVAAKRGISISFLGPDGSGKSTIIAGLLASDLPFQKVEYFHLKPLVAKNTSSKQTVENPHQYETYSVLKSYAKLLVFVLQYNFGWWKNIRLLLKEGALVVFDRYYDDILVDYKRYRYGGSINAAKWVSKFIPKPDIYLVLTADSETIYERKQEVPIGELQRQLIGYANLGDNKKYIQIDVSKSPDEIVGQIKKLILQKMNEG